MARLPKPGRDSGDWGAILNEFLLVAHTEEGYLRLPIWESDAERPAKAAENQVGINQARGCLEIFHKGAWTPVELQYALANLASFVKAEPNEEVQRPISKKVAETVSLLDFGASPDGTKDSTQYLQTALRYCREHGIGKLHIPSGRYKLTQPLTLGNGSDAATRYDFAGLQIVGDGRQTVLSCGLGMRVAAAQDLLLRDLSIEVPAGLTSAALTIGAGSSHISFSHCDISTRDTAKSLQPGIVLEGDGRGSQALSQIALNACRIRHFSQGVLLLAQGTDNPEAITVRDCVIESVERGIIVRGRSSVGSFQDLLVEGSTISSSGIAIELDSSVGVSVQGSRCSAERATQVVLIRGGRGVCVLDNRLFGSLPTNFISCETDIQRELPTKLTIRGNRFFGLSSGPAISPPDFAPAHSSIEANIAVDA